MKILDIAFKDLLRSFRSAFGLVMMFVAPLLITGLIYLLGAEINALMKRMENEDHRRPDRRLK